MKGIFTERPKPVEPGDERLTPAVRSWFQKIAGGLRGEVYLAEQEGQSGVVSVYHLSTGESPGSRRCGADEYLSLKAENMAAQELFDEATVCRVTGGESENLLELAVFFPHSLSPAMVRRALQYADNRVAQPEPEYLPRYCCKCPATRKPGHDTCPIGKPCRFVKQYVDERGWKYRVMGDLAGTYKTRYQKPEKHGDVCWKGCPRMERYKSFDDAQAELNKHARRKGWLEYNGRS